MHTTPRANGVVVSWAAIPARQQRGCITGYQVYLQKKDRGEAPGVYGRQPARTDGTVEWRSWEGPMPSGSSAWSGSHGQLGCPGGWQQGSESAPSAMAAHQQPHAEGLPLWVGSC